MGAKISKKPQTIYSISLTLSPINESHFGSSTSWSVGDPRLFGSTIVPKGRSSHGQNQLSTGRKLLYRRNLYALSGNYSISRLAIRTQVMGIPGSH